MEKYEGGCASIGNPPKDVKQVTQQAEKLQRGIATLHIAIEKLSANLYAVLKAPYPKVEQNKAKDACKPDEAQLVPLAVQLHRIRSRVISAADMISNINTRLEL